MASPECLGVNLDSISLIKLLSIFGNSKNLERDFSRLAKKLLKCKEKEKSGEDKE